MDISQTMLLNQIQNTNSELLKKIKETVNSEYDELKKYEIIYKKNNIEIMELKIKINENKIEHDLIEKKITENEQFNMVVMSLLVYVWFIMTTKLDLTWNIGILILLTIYFLYESKQITDYKIQLPEEDEIDTLYLMSRCRGSICSNSTLSWFGSYFQSLRILPDARKHIYMPYPWVNKTWHGFTDENTRDIYPDWATVYDTINSKFR